MIDAMNPTVLEKTLLQQTQELPEEAIQQLIDFARFLRSKQGKTTENDITTELKQMSSTQTAHLEEEFEGYQQMYPRERE